jgi:hypothetical protein
VTFAFEIPWEVEQICLEKSLKVNRECDILVLVLPLATGLPRRNIHFHYSIIDYNLILLFK